MPVQPVKAGRWWLCQGRKPISMTGGTIPARVQDVAGTCTIRVDVQGLGAQTTRTNRIPVENASGTLQGTDTVLNPTDPARADLVDRELEYWYREGI